MIYWRGRHSHITPNPGLGEILLFKVIANICRPLEPYKAEICLKHSKTNIEP